MELGLAWVQKARESGDPGHYLQADAAAQAALALDPKSRPAAQVHGLVLLDAHAFEEARRLADGLLESAPDDMAALGMRADALVELGRYEECERDVQRMLSLKPGLVAYSRASYLFWLRGNVRRAIETARLAVGAAADPADPEPRAWALTQAALLFWHEGDLEGADAGFSSARELLPGYGPALVGAARVRLARGDPAAAVPLLEEAWKRTPLVETGRLLGEARAALGNTAGAKEAWALAAAHGRASDPRSLAILLTAREHAGPELDEALRVAREEQVRRPDVWSDDALAWALYRGGKLAEARTASDRARRLGTRDAGLLYHAGAIRLAQGERGEGLRLLRAALALHPGFDPAGAADAKALLSPQRRVPPTRQTGG